ncbi:MAG: threonine synthase, partial [Anaerolineaceae bacterium]|nr:threonine synthase [Anaerolineaceae bacterium]
SAAIIAGAEKYLRQGIKEQNIVTVFTGHGLKATEKMLHLS